MTPIDQATRTAQAGHELLQASGDVIARRLEIVADALRDPMKADLRELSLMGSEKVEALTASAEIGMNSAMAMALFIPISADAVSASTFSDPIRLSSRRSAFIGSRRASATISSRRAMTSPEACSSSCPAWAVRVA